MCGATELHAWERRCGTQLPTVIQEISHYKDCGFAACVADLYILYTTRKMEKLLIVMSVHVDDSTMVADKKNDLIKHNEKVRKRFTLQKMVDFLSIWFVQG